MATLSVLKFPTADGAQTSEILSTNLPQEKEDELRAAFGAE